MCNVITHARWTKLLGMQIRTKNTSITIALLLFWLWFILAAIPQVPQESLWLFNHTFGSCGSFHLSQLGNFDESTQQGLVAQNLQYLAHSDNEQGSTLYTLEYPFVRIIGASITCSSRALLTNQYSTITVRVNYYCSGVACRQEPPDVKERRYVHLFSFACTIDGTEYVTLDHFTRHPYVNRSTENSGLLLVYKCRYCSVDPNVRDSPENGPRFHADTGCLGMLQ